MQISLRIVHLLALGLWFGSVTFFSFCTALPIIRHMEAHAERPDHWLHLNDRKLGVRVAGDALEPVFELYFPLQVICGAATILTIRAWHGGLPNLARARLGLLGLAFLLACLNAFFLAQRVHEVRNNRYETDAQIAAQAEQAFGTWHSISLWTDMAGLACVTVGFALAAVPTHPQARQAPDSNGS